MFFIEKQFEEMNSIMDKTRLDEKRSRDNLKKIKKEIRFNTKKK